MKKDKLTMSDLPLDVAMTSAVKPNDDYPVSELYKSLNLEIPSTISLRGQYEFTNLIRTLKEISSDFVWTEKKYDFDFEYKIYGLKPRIVIIPPKNKINLYNITQKCVWKNGDDILVYIWGNIEQGYLCDNLPDLTSNDYIRLCGIEFYFSEKRKKDVDKIIAAVSKYRVWEAVTKNTINIIAQNSDGLYMCSYNLNKQDCDISINYGKDFVKIHNHIVENLNGDGRGIVLLHGDPGTGKTSYIRHLTQSLTRKVIYLPPSMSEVLSNPSLITFLMSYPRSILLIEDAENAIRSRDLHNSSQAVSNLLNMSDGLLADALQIKIIATFNTEKESIDAALLRPGRLIAEHKFEKLKLSEAEVLMKKLGVKADPEDIRKEYSLAEIFQMNKPRHASFDRDTKKIGFSK